jgi:hypothetical protein
MEWRHDSRFRTSAELVDFGVLSTWLDIVGAVVVPLYLCCRVRSVRRCVRPLRLGVLCPAIARQRPPLARAGRKSVVSLSREARRRAMILCVCSDVFRLDSSVAGVLY